jgi:hypothetical protein
MFTSFIALLHHLKREAKDLISNLQIKHEKFLVTWQLVTQHYNNKGLIVMMHAKNCQVPHLKKGDATSMRQLIDHVCSHMTAFQALSLNESV